ncbi:hypothetical protein FGIG_07495 [Fasciola gigantica]|uniref:Uncharacterized protein n=1 Tax=Fasciola gigantica TaxID=46835 RepID=A0A504YG19_FASGI|nr:hypothetical protein FGIG_07495 [Fasciola gigantica]
MERKHNVRASSQEEACSSTRKLPINISLAQKLGHPNRIPRSQPSGTSATEQIPVGSSESTNPQSPVGSKISPSTTTSPSVLSRMTTAVSSFAAAIISPRRLQAPPAREPTPVEMQDLPKISRPHQTQFTSREMELAAPHGSISDDSSDFTVTSRDPVPSKFTSGTKPLTSRPRTTMCSPPDWNRFPWRRTGTEPDAVKGSTVEFVPVAGNIGKSAKGSNVEPFAVPILPKNDRAPTLKRKPLGEIPGANKDSHLPALGRTDSAEEKKVPELEPGSFGVGGPLAESTAGPFRIPVSHPLPNVVPKRARVDVPTKTVVSTKSKRVTTDVPECAPS